MNLRDYQTKAIKFLDDRPQYALYWEMRVGKSPTILTHLLNLVNTRRVKKIIIVAPPSALPGWLDEIVEWTPFFVPYLFHTTLDQFKLFDASETGLFLVSYARIGKPEQAKVNKKTVPLKDYKYYVIHDSYIKNVDCIVFDESQNIKNYKAQQTRWALSLSSSIKYKYLLSGTPIGGSEVDYYYQMNILNKSIFHGMNKNQFIAGYFTSKQTGNSRYAIKHTLNPRATKDFFTELRKYSSSLKLSDVVTEMPTIQHINIPLFPTEKQRSLIKKLKDDFFLVYKDKEIKAVNILAEITKILQICNGHILDSDGISHSINPNPKEQWLAQNIRALVKTSKVIIWIIYKKDREVIKGVLDSFKMRYVNFRSGMSLKDRKMHLDRFKQSPDANVFVAHPDSAGTGVDLGHAPTTIVYGRNYNWLSYKQAISRNVTYGQKHVTIYQLYIKELMDETVKNVLDIKGKTSDANLKQLLMKSFLSTFGK